MKIIAFTYEADYHCPTCAIKRFGQTIMADSRGLRDSEGNEPHAVFSTDEILNEECCGDCFEKIN